MTAAKYPDAPRAAVGVLVFKGERVLLIKRGNAPSKGLWSVPGGRVELGETLQQAAEREVLEETGLLVRAGRPIYTFDMIDRDEDGRVKYHFVIVDVSAEFIGGDLKAGDDAAEARWVLPEEMADLGVSERTIGLLKKTSEI